jgi:hypothetical protein
VRIESVLSAQDNKFRETHFQLSSPGSLDRATQYSEAPVMESRRCGVLNPRLRGDDGFLWSSAVRHIVSRHSRRLGSLNLNPSCANATREVLVPLAGIEYLRITL